jgi:elongation factor G
MRAAVSADDEFVPVIEIEVELTSVDRAALLSTLAKLAADDVQFRFLLEDDTRRVTLSGIDEGQLDRKIDALRRIPGARISVQPPTIAFRETTTRRFEIDSTHKKLTAGGGEFAKVKLVVEPPGPESGYACHIRTDGSNLPDEFAAGAQRGLERGLQSGIVAGFPVVGVTVTLADGGYHELDSSADIFAVAATAAVREALRKGGAVLLEPMMKIEVATPGDCAGQIVDDLALRRGRILVRGLRDGLSVIVANVPATNMLGYGSALRAMSGGRASYKSRFDSYEPVRPPDDPTFRPAIGLRA